MSSQSLVRSYGFNWSSCGYCNAEEATSHKFGISADTLLCQDYQALIDRGWRRLDAIKFQPSKSQRKLINRFNRFIEGTYVPSNSTNDEEDNDELPDFFGRNQPRTTKAKKSKQQVGKDYDMIESIHEAENKENYKHNFKIVLEPSSFSREKYQIYRKYQIEIHKDEEDELSESGFRRFLVKSPLKCESTNIPGYKYGSFHQCYYLDNKLIAVAVLDILPKCISSVYFFYEPDFGFLRLGTYSALREIIMTKEYYNVGLEELRWYYMGFYIHTCPKMKYKAQYKPSDLLDPETYEWHPIERCKSLLDKYKYVSFDNPPDDNKGKEKSDDENVNLLPGIFDSKNVTSDEIENIPISINETIVQFKYVVPYLGNSSGIIEHLKKYYTAVGPELAKKMVFIC
ncbi:464_t:CDS:2 [Diversispora eburnea]|uniref:Arginyl-tRNA--protein transferase 1 n=1 Tax=Diversispora eburnea TaxID=1213867 RepID=A0A9N9FMH4_9GLOM|nr:464_t:CDS:2 [Diversispora eburnea]